MADKAAPADDLPLSGITVVSIEQAVAAPSPPASSPTSEHG